MYKIKYCIFRECVFVALGIQHAVCMHRIVICGLHGSTVFFHISYKWHVFLKRKVAEYKMCVLIFSTTVV